MRVVVFAYTPPPHHGQSYMVELMLRGFADPRYGVECFHVNARFASSADDIGKFRPAKAFLLFAYCFKAIWFRLRHRAVTLYYVPTPPAKTPLIRDWLVLLICKPFFHHVIFHWHAAGLGEWIEKQPVRMQRLTRLAHGHVDVSISLGQFNQQDAARFNPQRTVIVPNGIPDPCPNFSDLARARRERLERRLPAWNNPTSLAAPVTVRVLFLGLCTPEKGLYDAVQGTIRANALCSAAHVPITFHLTIAGSFPSPAAQLEFDQFVKNLDGANSIAYLGFVTGDAKTKLLADCDLFCFPTYYAAENLSLVLLEAMAFGMPILTTKWRSLPDILPPNYPGLVEIKSPEQIASALFLLAGRDDSQTFRQRYLQNYTLETHLQNLSAAFQEADHP